MARLGIYCPTFKRPGKLQEVSDNIKANTKNSYVLYWGVEPFDTETIETAKKTGDVVVINSGKQGYSDTIQTIYEQSNEEYWFHANDDFYFPENWDEKHIEYLDANQEVMVLGAHDGAYSPSYSTISFCRRKYIEEMSGVVDKPNRVFGPYRHNYIDTEFTQTAQKRNVWARITDECIVHKHPAFTGEEKDYTYKKNDELSPEDERTFDSRKHLWKSL